MRFEINLASQPYQDVQRFLLRWGAALVVLAIVTIGLAYTATSTFLSWRVAGQRVGVLRQQIARLDQQKAAAEQFLNRPENRQVRERSQFLNNAIARKAFSWTEVFNDLETLVPPRLHVVSIRPEVSDDNQLMLRLSVAGSARDAAVELVRRLEKSPHFAAAAIDAEIALQPSGRETDVVRFEISALYVPNFARPRSSAAGDKKPPVRDADASAPQPAGGGKKPAAMAPAPKSAQHLEVRNVGH
jgi:Tfp pilus assembly protein PilN